MVTDILKYSRELQSNYFMIFNMDGIMVMK